MIRNCNDDVGHGNEDENVITSVRGHNNELECWSKSLSDDNVRKEWMQNTE